MKKFVEPDTSHLTTFETKSTEMVVLKGHQAWGFCPHHLLPVRYEFKIGYLPNGKVLGLSKLARIANNVIKGMPMHEDIPHQVVSCLEEILKPKGAGCLVRGEHFCMKVRGVESEHSNVSITRLSGVLLEDEGAKMEFLMT